MSALFFRFEKTFFLQLLLVGLALLFFVSISSFLPALFPNLSFLFLAPLFPVALCLSVKQRKIVPLLVGALFLEFLSPFDFGLLFFISIMLFFFLNHLSQRYFGDQTFFSFFLLGIASFVLFFLLIFLFLLKDLSALASWAAFSDLVSSFLRPLPQQVFLYILALFVIIWIFKRHEAH